jgi:transposase
MDPKTAGSIVHEPDAPKSTTQRTYRTHRDKLAPYWPEIDELLRGDSKLKAYALFEEMRRRHPDAFEETWKRTLERRVREWKHTHRVERDVTFDQDHQPGDVLAIDFTDMNELKITIANEPFNHKVFHAVLTYSNAEFVEVCRSESFEALARGLQGAFQFFGGVTERIRNDSMSAAVNNLSSDRHFTKNFQRLIDHFGVRSHRINVRTPRENGDCESQHGHLKDYVDQRLRLRGSRDFESIGQWKVFLNDCVQSRNQARHAVLREEQSALAELPQREFPVYTEWKCLVTSNSIIQVAQNKYSVPSCFIGSRLQIRVHADEIQVWHAAKLQHTIPRLVGKNEALIDFRDVIDSLVRKPGAFTHYRYREHMFPSLEYRKAFDKLIERFADKAGVRVYLRILQVAKYEGMAAVDALLSSLLLGSDSRTHKQWLEELKTIHAAVPVVAVDDVRVEQPELGVYDGLLQHKEVLDESYTAPECRFDDQGTCPISTGYPFEAPAATNDPCNGPEPFGAGFQRTLDVPAVSRRVDAIGMRNQECQSHSTSVEGIGTRTEQDMGPSSVGATTNSGTPTHGPTSERRVPGAGYQSADLRATRFWEDDAAQCTWGCASPCWPHGLYGTVYSVGTTSVVGQEGVATTSIDVEACEVLSADHRRYRLCTAVTRGDGSPLHVDRQSLREVQHSAEFESSVLEVGEHLQGPDDDSSCDRQAGASQRHPRAERTELPTRACEHRQDFGAATCFTLKQELFRWGILNVAKAEF